MSFVMQNKYWRAHSRQIITHIWYTPQKWYNNFGKSQIPKPLYPWSRVSIFGGFQYLYPYPYSLYPWLKPLPITKHKTLQWISSPRRKRWWWSQASGFVKRSVRLLVEGICLKIIVPDLTSSWRWWCQISTCFTLPWSFVVLARAITPRLSL